MSTRRAVAVFAAATPPAYTACWTMLVTSRRRSHRQGGGVSPSTGNRPRAIVWQPTKKASPGPGSRPRTRRRRDVADADRRAVAPVHQPEQGLPAPRGARRPADHVLQQRRGGDDDVLAVVVVEDLLDLVDTDAVAAGVELAVQPCRQGHRPGAHGAADHAARDLAQHCRAPAPCAHGRQLALDRFTTRPERSRPAVPLRSGGAVAGVVRLTLVKHRDDTVRPPVPTGQVNGRRPGRQPTKECG